MSLRNSQLLRQDNLCGSSLSLAAILAALSPHPKIPFLAALIRPGGG
jgi:hypothetical protein